MKVFAIVAASLTLALNGLADGAVGFQNFAFAPVKIYNFVTLTTDFAIPADNLVVGLFWGTTAGSATSLVATASIAATPHYGKIAGPADAPIPGTNPGDIGYFQVAAWYASYGDTVAGMNACIAAGAYWGSPGSTVYGVFGPAVAITLVQTPAPGTPVFGEPGSGLLPGFTITGTPEPGTITMSGFGVATLLLLYRCK